MGFAACGRDTTEPGARPGLTIVEQPATTDTIYAAPTQALVVELRDPRGRPIPDAEIIFEAAPPADPARGTVPTMSVCDVIARVCVLQQDPLSNPAQRAFVRTDASGRARATVQFGAIAGPGVVRVFQSTGSLNDSVRFTVTPGAPAGVRFPSRDTTLMVGSTVGVNGRVVDRMGNTTTGAVAFRVSGNATSITFDSVTRRATGSAFGVARIVATSGTFSDSMAINVVPRARLVLWAQFDRAVRLMNTDGTDVSTVLGNMDSSNGVFPRFSPTRDRVIGIESGFGLANMTIAVADTMGNGRFQPSTGVGLFQIFSVRLMADGSTWAGASKTGEFGVGVWRVDVNGFASRVTDLEGAANFGYGFIDVAGDGSRVVYVSTFGPVGTTGLRVINVATRVSTLVAGEGARTPRLSPDAQRVAYRWPVTQQGVTRNELRVMNVDGTGMRTVSPLNFGDGLTWSPDGQFIIGAVVDEDGGPAWRMVRVSDGAVVPMNFRSRTGALLRYLQPDW